MTTSPPAAIEVAGLSKSYGRQQVVADVSLTVRPGSVTGFLGPNGAGKSTTLRILVGLAGPGHPGPFVGTWIEIAAMAVAVVAGIAALAVGNRRLAGP
jgi:ABC-type Na+ transport system ATPase subunit NatA